MHQKHCDETFVVQDAARTFGQTFNVIMFSISVSQIKTHTLWLLAVQC